MAAVNAAFADDWIRHAVLLERFKDGEIKRLMAFLNKDVMPSIVAKADKIATRYQRMGYSKLAIARRRRALMKQLRGMDSVVKGGTKLMHARLTGTMATLAKSEAKWAAQTMQRRLPLRLDYTMPSPQLLKSIITTRPMAGRFLKDWSKNVGANTAMKVNSAIMVGVAQGEGVETIVRRIRGSAANGFKDGVLQATRNEAAMVTRTAINHVGQHAREAVFAENKQVVELVEWLSVLDSRTSQICASLDSQTYEINKGPRPPAHPNCRSVMIPVVKPPEGIPGIDASKLPVGERAAMAGPVPANMSFGPWLKKQPAAVQNQILGVGKGKLFRRGKVPIERFSEIGGSSAVRPLSLAELESIEAKLAGVAVPKPLPVTKPKPVAKPKPAPVAVDETGAQLRARLKIDARAGIADVVKSDNRRARLEKKLQDHFDKVAVWRDRWQKANQTDKWAWLDDPQWDKFHAIEKALVAEIRVAKMTSKRLRLDLSKNLRAEIATGGNANMRYDYVSAGKRYNHGPGYRGISQAPSDAFKAQTKDADRFLRKLWRTKSPTDHRTMVLSATARQRSFQFKGKVYMGGGVPTKTFVHEMAHHIENLHFSREARMYRAFRGAVRGKDGNLKLPRKLNVTGGRKPGEVGWADEWMQPYTGKYYDHGSSEILSMLTETLYDDAYALMTKDPRAFDFIIDTMRGIPVERQAWYKALSKTDQKWLQNLDSTGIPR